MASHRSQYDVVIAGAGLIGATFAALLAERFPHYHIALIERANALEPNLVANQRVVALGHLAKALLSEISVWQSLNIEHCFPYERMLVWDENSHGELEFAASDITPESDVPLTLGHMVDSHECTRLVQERLAQYANVDVLYQSHIEQIHSEGDSTEIECLINGEPSRMTAQLLVGADGARSSVRRLAKISSSAKSYHQTGVVARLRAQHSHRDTAWQCFTREGPIGVLPLDQNDVSIVWSCSTESAEELMALDDAAFCQALTHNLQGRLGEFELQTERQAFALKSQRAERYCASTTALLGDAAHSIHPLAGQGANLGFKDIECLLAQLSDPTERPLLQRLARYQSRRAQDNRLTDQMMSWLNEAFLASPPWWLALRGVGMNWISGSTTLRQLLIRHAVGMN